MSDPLQWSSPIRRIGDVNLSSIPNEIYLAIFSYIRTDNAFANRIFLNLARVCRFFCAVTIPRLFEHVRFKSKGVNDANTPQNRADFCRSIQNGDSSAKIMAQHVKTCTLSNWDMRDEHLGWWMSTFFSLYTRSMRSMTNIQELNIHSSRITKDLLKAMAHLPQLESLIITNCHVADEVNARHFSKLSSLRLKKICFICLSVADIIGTNIFGTDEFGYSLDSFNPLFDWLDLKCITEVTSSNWHLFRRLSVVEGDLRLEKAVFYSLEDTGVFMSILAKAPALRHLRISELADADVQVAMSNSIFLPALATVEVSPELLASLVPGRPVEEVELRSSSITPGLLRALKSSSKGIQRMRVSPEIYLEIPFWKHFTDLKTLQITTTTRGADSSMQDLEHMLSDLACKWPTQPPIQSLVVFLSTVSSEIDLSLDLVQQHGWITDIIFPKFPDLRDCRFFRPVSWFYLEEDSQWKPEIAESYAQDIVNRLLVARYQDYNNCFETLRLHSIGQTISNFFTADS
ncbi:hypothetical protein CVT25_002554 [Psilocybe cyanescens]|uniref:Uncharacterized protein n=1 Tax=Psilocybe cyanescens TaxID=93625 RepID=A0A409XK72_PSICY|nr:hypothetical protein CVT25_002554 [Psilocybe cyanescens]